MNMKKTIAAVAAGAVAVSAMATSVSALEDTILAYSLVANENVWPWSAGTATYEFTVTGAAADAAEITFVGEGAVDSVTIKVADAATGEQNKMYSYSTSKDKLNYNANIANQADGKTCIMTLTNELADYTDVVMTITVNTVTYKDSNAAINDLIIAGDVAATATATVTPVTVKAATLAGSTATLLRKPFKTSLTGNQDIISYLMNDANDLKGLYSGSYDNVPAVLNDAIENFESVTFTFNTATENIAWYYDGKTYGATDMSGSGENAGNYNMALAAAGGDASKLVAIYDGSNWWSDGTYTSFGQHLYTNEYVGEGTGWAGFDWTGYNLFQGALIVNEAYTMSLAETDYFDWTATSLSFDWDAIMDGAMTSNGYATWLHDMKLATSNTWYWDNLLVTLTAGAADDVENEAGVEAGDETLEEEVVEEEVEEEVVEEEEEEEVEVEVSNPTTGNASVALAVIPVALAAAAIVAKKRS